jgi:hypothetical protein
LIVVYSINLLSLPSNELDAWWHYPTTRLKLPPSLELLRNLVGDLCKRKPQTHTSSTLSHNSYSNRALCHPFQLAILCERSQDLLRIGRVSVTVRWFTRFSYTGSYSPATQGTTSAKQDQLKDGIDKTT